MIPMFNMKMFASHYQVISNYVEKLNRNELTLEDILREDDLVNDLKTNGNSQFNSFFNKDNIKLLIDYSIKMPEKDNYIEGHKYPFNACEILSSDSDMIIELLTHKVEDESDKNSAKGKIEVEVEEDDLRDKPNDMDDDAVDISGIKKKILSHDLGEGTNDLEIALDEMKISSPKEDIEERKEELDPPQMNNDELLNEANKENKDEDDLMQNDQVNYNNAPPNDDLALQEKDEDTGNCNHESLNTTIIYKQGYTTLNYLFNFLNMPPDESNYVLIGYFNKIFNNLIEKKGDIIISYVLNSRDLLLDNLIQHLNRQLIGECAYRILTYPTEGNTVLNERKVVLINKMIEVMETTVDEEKYDIICTTLRNSISNRHFFKLLMMRIDIFEVLFTNLKSDKAKESESNLRALYSLLNQLMSNVLRAFQQTVTAENVFDSAIDMKCIQVTFGIPNTIIDFENKSKDYLFFGESDEVNQENLQLALFSLFKSLINSKLDFLDDLGLLPNDKSKAITETTYQRSQKKLGFIKLTQAKLFSLIIDIIINSINRNYLKDQVESVLDVIINSNIFSALIELFFSFEFNNLYQNIFNSIFVSVINKHSPSCLINHVFIKEGILEKMKDNLLLCRLFSYNSKRLFNSGLFAFEVNYFNEVNSTSNEYLNKIIEEKKDIGIFKEIYANDINCIFKGKLCQNESNDPFNNKQAQQKKLNENGIDSSFELEPLNEMIKSNLSIYDVYRSGGDYQALLDETKKEKEKKKKEKKEEPLTVKREELDDDIEINDEIIVDLMNNDKVNEDKSEEESKEIYFDNNYWRTNPLSVSGFIEEELLNEL